MMTNAHASAVFPTMHFMAIPPCSVVQTHLSWVVCRTATPHRYFDAHGRYEAFSRHWQADSETVATACLPADFAAATLLRNRPAAFQQWRCANQNRRWRGARVVERAGLENQ